jgi:hypothetical protein
MKLLDASKEELEGFQLKKSSFHRPKIIDTTSFLNLLQANSLLKLFPMHTIRKVKQVHPLVIDFILFYI